MNKEKMICGICNKEVHPLDAHMGRCNNELIVAHIDCWNKQILPLIELFNYEEGTKFLTFGEGKPIVEVWVEDSVLKVEKDNFIKIFYDGDNRALISKEWLESKFILKE